MEAVQEAPSKTVLTVKDVSVMQILIVVEPSLGPRTFQ
jgi:hypothetical protein